MHRHRVVRKERRQLLSHPARARAQPSARLCQWRVSPRLFERRAQPAAAAAAASSDVFVRAAISIAATAAGNAAAVLQGACATPPTNLDHTPPPLNIFKQDAEQCIPLPRLADFGLDLGVDAVEGAPMEERASCLFVRRVAEERRRASACFSRVASPDPPPPPPAFNVTDTSGAGSLRAQRERLGDLEKYEEPRRTDTAQWSFDKSGALDGTKALIDSLGETNPVLKSLLDTAMDEIEAAAGRRLMQRVEYETYMTDVLVTHELMEFYGKGGIPGLTYGSCLSLCEATKQDERAKHTEHCSARTFKPPCLSSAKTHDPTSVSRRHWIQAGRSLFVHGPDGLVLPAAKRRRL